jgi:hypothetical protein
MAGKEATIYILDLGRSMGEKRHGRNQTDLDWALEYVWDKITTTVSRRSFGDLVRQISLGGLMVEKLEARTTSCVDRIVGCDRQEERPNERDWLSYR